MKGTRSCLWRGYWAPRQYLYRRHRAEQHRVRAGAPGLHSAEPSQRQAEDPVLPPFCATIAPPRLGAGVQSCAAVLSPLFFGWQAPAQHHYLLKVPAAPLPEVFGVRATGSRHGAVSVTVGV